MEGSMNTVCQLNRCTGCMLCYDRCPKRAVEIVDSLEAYNAVINHEVCVGCGECHKLCQQNHIVELKKPISWYQGWASDEKIRSESSSGGIGASLMGSFYRKYGNVCACTFENGEFKFRFVDSAEDIKNFVGSKYVKSNPKGIYEPIKNRILHGEKVLFIGLPCQVAAVKGYVGKENGENLYTVDLVCHGTPSPKFVELFLKDYHKSLEETEDIKFRKKNGFQMSVPYESILPPRLQDEYTYAFLNGLDYTENCYSCNYARLDRVADITLGDAWGSNLGEEEKQKGISLILCQTEKGEAFIHDTELHIQDIELSKAVAANRQLNTPSLKPEKRKVFFDNIHKISKFNPSVKRCYPQEFYKQKAKLLLIKWGILSGERSDNQYHISVLEKSMKQEEKTQPS
ncbi:MAG: Coenzyme F420 hydrogenase/dehydrogenase, beta subunit C-terminal domain [Eubacteriales bacterium]